MQTNTSHYLAALAVTFAAIAGSAIAADFNPQPDPPGKTQKRDAAMHNPPGLAVATPDEKCISNAPADKVGKKAETRTATELTQMAQDKKLNAYKTDAAACPKK